MDLSKELEQLKYALSLQQEIDCSDEENEKYRKMLQNNETLPVGVFNRNSDCSVEYANFYKLKKTSLSKDELSEYLQYKQLKSIITIKNCVVFFTVLAAISLTLGLIEVLSLLSL